MNQFTFVQEKLRKFKALAEIFAYKGFDAKYMEPVVVKLTVPAIHDTVKNKQRNILDFIGEQQEFIEWLNGELKLKDQYIEQLRIQLKCK